MILVPRPPLAPASLLTLPRYAYAVRARGGDDSGGWVLAEGVARDREEGAAWLRAEALRLAVRIDPGPRSRWGRPPLVHEVPEGAPDAPTALRAFAEDRERLDTVRDLLAYGFPVVLRFPDVRGAWYELAADPLPPDCTPGLRSIEPPPCTAVTEVPALIADLARACTPLPGAAPVGRMPCALTVHESPEHVGAVRVLDRGAGAVWASFTDQLPPWRVRFMPPCAHLCPLYRDHPGRCRPPRREVIPCG
ncbi:formylmethionine deformylase [Streptomyces sp. SID11385]|uniref:formylmethionine deformylase n=1 Tax=Streptomyces sp. SID11385 TaxID=2706031 RepID=UPI0013C67788|nr:formylmethionine deformylase [Streptomyces sp. SID11385]